MNNSIIEKIEQLSKVEEVDYVKSCMLRECFDSVSSEWNNSTMEQKIEALKVLVKEKNHSINELIFGMLDYCNKEANKDIKSVTIAIALGQLLEHCIRSER